MGKLYSVLCILIIGMTGFSIESFSAELERDISSFENIYQEDFSSGLQGWSTAGVVKVEQKNNNKYIRLAGILDCSPNGGCYYNPAIMQKTLAGFKPNGKYGFSIKAIGVGKVSVNSQKYQISVNTGENNLDIDQARTYAASVVADANGHVQVTVLTYNSKMLIDDIKLVE